MCIRDRSFNRESIYQAVYGSSSSDDEDFQTLSDRLHGHENDIHAGTSYSQNKENLHPNLICPRTFLLINVLTEKKTHYL